MKIGKRILSVALCAAIAASMSGISASAEKLPEKYDSRDKEIISEVKNQGMVGSCWAFGGVGILETWLKLNGMGNYDFSERHMDIMTAPSFLDDFNRDTGSTRRIYGMGGYTSDILTYYYSGRGPVLEKDCAFIPSYEGTYSTLRGDTNCKTAGIMVKDVGIGKCYGDATEITVKKNDDVINGIKTAITKYGSVAATYDAETDETDFYSSSYNIPNHEILIVGWDDKYSKDNFVSSVGYSPNNDGAWIVKNSWGADFGNDGYFYMSYECPSLYREAYLYMERAAKTDYDQIYLSCPLAATAYRSARPDTQKNENYSLNIFDKTAGKQSVNEVTVALRENSFYEIYIIPDYEEGGDNNLGKCVASGSVDHECYKTVEFDPVKITGEKFGVCVKYSSNDKTQALIPVQENIYTVKDYLGEDFTGRSFVSADGINWKDTAKYDKELVFVRAYTVNEADVLYTVDFETNGGYETAKLYTKSGKEVYRNPDGTFSVENGAYKYEITQAGYETVTGKLTVKNGNKKVKVHQRYAPTITDVNTELGLKDRGDYEIYYVYGINGEAPCVVSDVKINGKSVKFTQKSDGISVERGQLSFLEAGKNASVTVTYSNGAKSEATVKVLNYTDAGAADIVAEHVKKEFADVKLGKVSDIKVISDKCDDLAETFGKKTIIYLNSSAADFSPATYDRNGYYSYTITVIYNGYMRNVYISGELEKLGRGSSPVMGNVTGWNNIMNTSEYKNGKDFSVTLSEDGIVPEKFWKSSKGGIVTFTSSDGSYSWTVDCSRSKPSHDVDMTIYTGMDNGTYSDGEIIDYYRYRTAGTLPFYTDSSFDITGDLTLYLSKYFSGIPNKTLYRDLLFRFEADGSARSDKAHEKDTIVTYRSGKTQIKNVSGGRYVLLITTDAYIYGDVDLDVETVSDKDYSALTMYILGGVPEQVKDMNPFAYAMMDINEDGTVDTDDLDALKKYIEETEKEKAEKEAKKKK